MYTDVYIYIDIIYHIYIYMIYQHHIYIYIIYIYIYIFTISDIYSGFLKALAIWVRRQFMCPFACSVMLADTDPHWQPCDSRFTGLILK
jgi:hypothetical protein